MIDNCFNAVNREGHSIEEEEEQEQEQEQEQTGKHATKRKGNVRN